MKLVMYHKGQTAMPGTVTYSLPIMFGFFTILQCYERPRRLEFNPLTSGSEMPDNFTYQLGVSSNGRLRCQRANHFRRCHYKTLPALLFKILSVAGIGPTASCTVVQSSTNLHSDQSVNHYHHHHHHHHQYTCNLQMAANPRK